ncbi:MAG: ATP-dependent RNA helicase, partial [Lentisphaeria bacterium]|nr:ATP-dependent RNA helicase [Lentisphaeria bacterium]
METIERLNDIHRKLRLTDRRKLDGKFRKLLDIIKSGRAQENSIFVHNFLIELEEAEKRSLERFTRRLHIEYPEKLPITAQVDELKNCISAHQVVIVCGATGSGKTTQLPKLAVECGCGVSGRIGCTQPRRLAATALAARFADETRVTLGKEAGYQIRFDDRTDVSTSVKFMTDGILLAETRNDPDLLQYDCLILDEVHERSLNIDFLLGYLKQLISRRRDIKIIISSATLESNRISEFFGNAPVMEIPGGLYPIEDIFMPLEEDEELNEGIFRASEFLGDLDPRGDILVFLPGEREIRECCEYLEG